MPRLDCRLGFAFLLWLGTVIVAMPGTIGCAPWGAKSTSLWPTAKKPKDSEPVGIKTAAQHIEELKAMEKAAKSASPDDQQRASQELAQRLQLEQDPLVRMQLVQTLAALPTPAATAALQAALTDSNADVRVACCQAWGRRQGSEATKALTQVLSSDTDIDVRLAATRALGEMRDEAAIPALGEALSDTDPALQYRAVQSLKHVSGRDFGSDMNAWREFAKNSRNAPPPTIAERLRSWFY